MLLLISGGFTIKAGAQIQRERVPLEFSVGYNAIRANAPPGGCSCFYLQGARAEVSLPLHGWLRAVAEVGGAHANNINSSGDGVGMITYLFGPRVTHRPGHRLSGFGQVLFGGAHGFNGYFPMTTTSSSAANAFAFSTGGGLDFSLSSCCRSGIAGRLSVYPASERCGQPTEQPPARCRDRISHPLTEQII